MPLPVFNDKPENKEPIENNKTEIPINNVNIEKNVVKRVNLSHKGHSIFDSNGVLLIGKHKIVKKKVGEKNESQKKFKFIHNEENKVNTQIPITKRIHK